jgi:hypothetical protein
LLGIHQQQEIHRPTSRPIGPTGGIMSIRTGVVCLVFIACAIGVQAQPVLPSEVQALEAAWATGQRLANTPVSITRGFDKPGPGAAAPVQNVSTDGTGIARTSTKFWERIVIHLPRTVVADHMACLMIQGKCQPLPVGASIDKKNSVLYWHVPNAYKGDFDLVFLQPGSRVGVVRVTAGTDSK